MGILIEAKNLSKSYKQKYVKVDAYYQFLEPMVQGISFSDM